MLRTIKQNHIGPLVNAGLSRPKAGAICIGLSLCLVLSTTSYANKKSSEPVRVQSAEKVKPVKKTPIQVMSKQQQIEFSQQDLSNRLELKSDEMQLSGAIRVTWRSGALGCPEAGMNYTQSLTPGVLIMLRVGNTAYRYHGSLNGQPFYCPSGRAESQYLNSSDI